MRILITNDDGIYASELIPLVQWAQTLGEVMVVAPKTEQSGMSHAIELHKSFEAKKIDLLPGVTAWAVDSSPADCVRLAVLGFHEKFDLLISGINRGLNIGCDMLYSGTVGAVFEAQALGVPQAIAVSTHHKSYEGVSQHMGRVWAFLQDNHLFDYHPYYNINIPINPVDFRITRQGGPYYSDDFRPDPDDMYHPMGKEVFQASGSDELDTDAVLRDDCISVMPLTICRTDMPVYDKLRKLHLK